MKLVDLANALSEKVKLVEIGIRPGEKLHEEMISTDDSRRTIRLSNRFVVTPIFAEWGYTKPLGEEVHNGFSYRSDTNDYWLTKQDIQEKVNEMFKNDSLR
jgi:UDP-N-acetylglucosamine 4,6-dehydratase/5-epimerase